MDAIWLLTWGGSYRSCRSVKMYLAVLVEGPTTGRVQCLEGTMAPDAIVVGAEVAAVKATVSCCCCCRCCCCRCFCLQAPVTRLPLQ